VTGSRDVWRALPRRALSSVITRLRPIASKLLPSEVRHRLAPLVHQIEARSSAALAAEFEARAEPLGPCPPLLHPDQFEGGPVVLVNNALAWGGVERQVVNTLRGLDPKLDRDVGLLCLRLGFGSDYDFYRPALDDFRGFVRNVLPHEEAAAILTNVASAPAIARARSVVAFMPADVREEIERFMAEFVTLKPAVVHVWQDSASISAGYAARLVGVPRIIISSRNVNPTNFAYFRPYMEHGYRELAACRDIVMINNSQAGADDYERWLGIGPGRFMVVRNGIDPVDFQRPDPQAVAALRRQLGLAEDATIVGSVFRFYDEKRPLLWLAAAALIARRKPQCHFVLFGTGPLADEMRSAASEHGFADRLHLPGTIAETAVGMSLFDVLVLTSSFEGTPNVLLEASLLGIPVVGTDAGGTREAIDHGRTGFVVDHPDAAEIAERVLDILDAPDCWRAVGEDGPAFVDERFGLERMLQETLAIYALPAREEKSDVQP
jgi:glycosyltransferase involved in cell wall biosynthesis